MFRDGVCVYSAWDTLENIEIEEETKMKKKMYMNLATGSVDDYDGWWYHDEDGDFVNAVDLGEVVEVEWNDKAGIWVEV